jgi:hypothetical protein
MPGSRSMRLVQAALRCYPRGWRSRRGDEAAELAALLIRDGVPARSIAWSYFKGAAWARISPEPHRRLGAAVGALLLAAGCLGVPLALLSSSAPASAAIVVRARITNSRDAAGQLRSLFRSRHFRISVTQEPVSPSLVGSIIHAGITGSAVHADSILSELTGPCPGGARGCIDGLALPAHFTGSAHVVVGRAAKPGERYAAAADIFRPGEMLHCSGLLGEKLEQALPSLESLHVSIAWEAGSGQAIRGPVAAARYYVAGGAALSSASISIRLTALDPAKSSSAGGHGRGC